MILITIDERAHLYLETLTPDERVVLEKLMGQMTYSNPKWEDAQRMGFSTQWIPRHIKTYTFEARAGSITFGRGELHRFFTAFGDAVQIREQLNEPDVLRSIAYVNEDFNLDERQERCIEAIKAKKQGIIHAATSAGKSEILLKSITERCVRTIIVVHRKVLLEQLVIDAQKRLRGVTIGVLKANQKELFDVTFAIDRTLEKLLKTNSGMFKGVGMIVQDEAHLAATNTFQSIISRLPCPYRFGLTGTVERKDRMQFLLFATFGPVICKVSKDELEEAGRTTPIKVEVVNTQTDVPEDSEIFLMSPTKQWQALEKVVHEDIGRVALCTALCRDIQTKQTPNTIKPRIVVITRFIASAKMLAFDLANTGFNVKTVTGQDANNLETCNLLDEGKIDVIVATVGVMSTGVNIKTLTDVVIFSPIFSNKLLLHQIRGRAMRMAEGKKEATIHVMYDGYLWPGRASRVVNILKH